MYIKTSGTGEIIARDFMTVVTGQIAAQGLPTSLTPARFDAYTSERDV